MKIHRCFFAFLVSVSFFYSFSFAEDSPGRALKKYENIAGSMLSYFESQSYGKNMSFEEYDAALKDKLLQLFRGCMTGDFLEEGEQRVEDRYAAGNCLAGSSYWYAFVPPSIATDLSRTILEDEPSRRVYSFKGRRGKTQINQK